MKGGREAEQRGCRTSFGCRIIPHSQVCPTQPSALDAAAQINCLEKVIALRRAALSTVHIFSASSREVCLASASVGIIILNQEDYNKLLIQK